VAVQVKRSGTEEAAIRRDLGLPPQPKSSANDSSTGAAAAKSRLRVTQVREAIGSKPKHRGTLRALGLGRIGRTSVLPDRPEIRGMIARVNSLVEVHSVKVHSVEDHSATEDAGEVQSHEPRAK
jgi:large subunit ribosomal protein L30